MILVHSSPNLSLEHHLKNILEGAGIECLVKNEYLEIGKGEVPPGECWIELWIEDDSREAEARQLVEVGFAAAGAPGESWRCGKCGEMVEPQFTECWNCGESRPGQNGGTGQGT